MKKSEKILLIILAVSVGIFILDRFVLSKKEAKPVVKKVAPAVSHSSAGTVPAPAAPVSPGPGGTPRGAAEPKTTLASFASARVYREWRRDPFLGAYTRAMLDSLRGDKKKEEKPFVLKAISWRDSSAYVIINDDVYKQGESKNGLTVLDVIGERVVCSFRGKKFILTLGE